MINDVIEVKVTAVSPALEELIQEYDENGLIEEYKRVQEFKKGIDELFDGWGEIISEVAGNPDNCNRARLFEKAADELIGKIPDF
jgi:hypothetical protein